MQAESLTASGKGAKEETQLVTFLLKDEEFGFDIMSVQEIIRLPKMAKVPRTPPYVDGIANLRGVVLPIIDVRSRFGMDRAEETDRTRVLVIDIHGTKTGLRVDRVKQVTRVSRGEIEPPPAAIRGTTTDYLDGVVKLDNGQRIIMALNAAQVCQMTVERSAGSAGQGAAGGSAVQGAADSMTHAQEDVRQMVTFRIAREEFAFLMEHVREILRVQSPKQVPEAPDYVLGVLTVRGQILPIIDLRTLLHQQPLAAEVGARCGNVREDYRTWLDGLRARSGSALGRFDLSTPERLRAWVTEFSSSSQVLMETLSKVRALNEKVFKQAQNLGKLEQASESDNARALLGEMLSTGGELLELMRQLEQQIGANIQEDQRIIVVDANGFLLGLVVDHVNEVLNVSKKLMDPPPKITSTSGVELSGIAKLEDGNRLIMLLDVAQLLRDQRLREMQEIETDDVKAEGALDSGQRGEERNELQLVTFMLGVEEYGIPISQIQEIDRLSRITKVPKAAHFVEGITNLRGEVIPVLDTRKRFDLEVKPADDRTRIIIVELGGVKTGLIVDSVREVLSLPRQDLAPPPGAISSGINQQFISGIGKVDNGKRMIVLLDVENILSRDEQTKLAEVKDQNRRPKL
jgi:purine-binding chemotaxis protein CheW